jgi:dTMP kinase
MLRRGPDATAFGAGTVGRVSGLFVTFEGIDRSGKTTQVQMLADVLREEAVVVREPGGTAVGERVRELLKDPGIEIGPHAEALLFAAARAELCRQVIRPALDQGFAVISDRFVDSSLAYQGEGRGLGVEEVREMNRWATDGLAPDLTLYLAIDPAAASTRAGEADRIEGEGARFQERIAQAYERLAADEPARWRRIDAARPPNDVHADVLATVVAARAASLPA